MWDEITYSVPNFNGSTGWVQLLIHDGMEVNSWFSGLHNESLVSGFAICVKLFVVISPNVWNRRELGCLFVNLLRLTTKKTLVPLDSPHKGPMLRKVMMSPRCLEKLVTAWGHATLHWRHNERYGVSNHQPHDCFLNRLFKAQIKENIKAPRHWPSWGEFTGDRWIPHTKGQ